MNQRVLVVDDEPSMCELLEARLSRRGFSIVTRTSATEALELLSAEPFDAVVTDLNMADLDGLEVCRRIVENQPDVPVILLTGFGSFDSAVAAIRAGAYDFITKPVEIEALSLTLTRAVAHRNLQQEVKRLRLAVSSAERFDSIVGESAPMRALRDLLARIADTDASVLVTGESGTGKEVVARAIHRASPRARGPFVAVNCAAVPAALLESELFGHAKGAFTDARAARTGLFAQAHGGTLFLDEIGDMPLELQPKILRAIEDRRIRPVGAAAEIPVDVHLISATHRDLQSAIEERRFREDLFFRIDVINVELPPLRARGADVLLLAQNFVREMAARSTKPVTGIAPAAAERLLSYAWPGNVRELRNCIERAVALTRFSDITVDDLPEKIRNYRPAHVVVAGNDPTELVTLEEMDRRYILRVLEAVAGNKTLAARVLDLDRRTLYRRLESYGVDTKKDP